MNNGAKNTKTTYTYNEDGIRIMKNFEGIKTRYLLDGTNIIAQEVTNGDSLDYIYFFYDASGSPVGMNYLGYNYYYKKNLQGDIIEIWGTEDGTDNHTFRRLVEYTYDAWGNILQMNDTTDGWFKVGTANPFRYRGYYYDNESGFYYLQSRYYDPATGRFLNADMMEYIGLSGTTLGYNAFLYCENGAIARIDYTGYYWHQNYKGFELTKNGFNVDENKSFLFVLCERLFKKARALGSLAFLQGVFGHEQHSNCHGIVVSCLGLLFGKLYEDSAFIF